MFKNHNSGIITLSLLTAFTPLFFFLARHYFTNARHYFTNARHYFTNARHYFTNARQMRWSCEGKLIGWQAYRGDQIHRKNSAT